MVTRNYETLFITRQDATEAQLSELHAKNTKIIESHKGKVLNMDNWGKRKFAYPIEKETRGQYFHLMFSANNEGVAELERQMRINDGILRFMTVKFDDEKDPMKELQAFKVRLEGHAKRHQERAQRDAEVAAERAERAERRYDRGDRESGEGENRRPARGEG